MNGTPGLVSADRQNLEATDRQWGTQIATLQLYSSPMYSPTPRRAP